MQRWWRWCWLWCPLWLVAAPLQAVLIDVKPWGMEIQPKGLIGIYVDAASLLGRQSGLPVQSHLRPYLRVPLEIASGEADFTIVADNEELDRSAIKVGVVQQLKLVAMPSAASGITTLQHLQHRRVAVLRGTNYRAQLDADLTPVDNYDQAFQMLLLRRVDAVMGVEQGLLYALRANAQVNAQRGRLGASVTVSTINASLYLSPKVSPPIQQRLRLAYETATQKHLFDRIFAGYR